MSGLVTASRRLGLFHKEWCLARRCAKSDDTIAVDVQCQRVENSG